VGKRSGLKYPEVIDIVVGTRTKDGAELIVLDVGDIPAPADRLDALQRKLVACANYVADGQLREQLPNAQPNNVVVRIVCRTPPTPQMRAIEFINVSNEGAQTFPLRITVEDETEYRTRVGKELGVAVPPIFAPEKKWWEVWK
jgi:hypothetical protein